MRYYLITIKNADGTIYREFRSQSASGNFIPGALNIELDIPIVNADIPIGGAFVRIWGISLEDLNQASDFNGKSIEVRGGMQRGLPLANPSQQGLLVNGSIFQAWGNWEGTEISIDLIITAQTGSPIEPIPTTLSCPAGGNFTDSIRNALTSAYPNHTVTMNIGTNIIPQNDINHYCESVTQVAQMVLPLSQSILNDAKYGGIKIAATGSEIIVYDGTSTPDPNKSIQLSYLDFIGQPSWIKPFTCSIKLVMRGDMKLSGYVKMPPPIQGTNVMGNSAGSASLPILNSSGSNPFVRKGMTFTGDWLIQSVRHVGSFRSPSADAWVTIVELFAPV